jgi:signal transduction histidine kinase
MSQTRSPAQPSPSRDEAVDQARADQSAILDVVALIEAHGLFGLIWLDPDLTVRRAYGRLLSFVAPSRHAAESLPALVGLAAELAALRDSHQRMIELPAISISTTDGLTEKFNLTLFWSEREAAIVGLAYRSEAQSTLEFELSRQIRARLMAEAEATALSRDLARANADLECFAAIISHDLKAPIRHMRGLASDAISNRRLANEASDAALTEIAAQAERMQHMLDHLFEYSMLGRKYEGLEEVDTGDLVRTIVKSFPDSAIEIVIEGDWPALRTLRAPLELSIRNLVGNALQHHDRNAGLVRIGCIDSQDAIVITVEDDGPGVPIENQRAIFLPFRTAGETTNAQSTGMGLAMVDRAVTAVGGAVTLSSNPAVARGAIFAVQWPKIIDFG